MDDQESRTQLWMYDILSTVYFLPIHNQIYFKSNVTEDV